MIYSINEDLAVGIMGGMGPYATLALFKYILGNTPADKDWDHLRIIIDNNPKIPSRTRSFLFDEEDPVPAMVQSAAILKNAGADFIVLPCNSAHYFLPRVLMETAVPFLNMIDETSKLVLSRKPSAVGILAGEVTVRAELYEQRLAPHGVAVKQVTEVEQTIVREVIEDVKKNIISARTYDKFQCLIGKLENRGVDAIILGCTELSIAMGEINANCEVVDSLEVLAKAVVNKAKRIEGNESPTDKSR